MCHNFPTEYAMTAAPSAVCRWSSFAIRSLPLVIAVVALPCSWRPSERPRRALEQQAAVAAIEKIGGRVDYENDEKLVGGGTPNDKPFVYVTKVELSGIGNAELESLQKHLERLPRLKSLLISGSVTDAGLEYIEGLHHLQTLNLNNSNVTDVGLRIIAELNHLESLHLRCTKVTDVGLEFLKPLTRLKSLSLGGTQVTDAGLKHLAGLTQLQSLDLGWTKISEAGP